MKLSEAIRLGSMLAPQSFYGIRQTEQARKPGDVLGLSERVVATCALGAAFQAGGCGVRTVVADGRVHAFRGSAAQPGDRVQVVEVNAEWSRLLLTPTKCPRCERRGAAQRIVAHMNDEHCLSREEIADWVETLEAAPRATVFINNVEVADLVEPAEGVAQP